MLSLSIVPPVSVTSDPRRVGKSKLFPPDMVATRSPRLLFVDPVRTISVLPESANDARPLVSALPSSTLVRGLVLIANDKPSFGKTQVVSPPPVHLPLSVRTVVGDNVPPVVSLPPITRL